MTYFGTFLDRGGQGWLGTPGQGWLTIGWLDMATNLYYACVVGIYHIRSLESFICSYEFRCILYGDISVICVDRLA